MYMPHVLQPKSSSNEYGHREIERDTSTRFDSQGEQFQSNSRDRLVYLTTCLIGHQVDVQVLDGSIISGIFHATNAEDFGIVLKMAHSVKDGSQGQKNISDSLNNPHSKTVIIPARDLVQVIAKDVSITRNGFTNELQHEKQQELMTDSCISRSGHVAAGRELERWVPDESDPGCPELENIFDGSWNRGWDQFQVNESLFGVKSTFDEELYTTKLDRGPQMRELEREAVRIAREIEGQETHDLHLAEERGIQLDGSVEMDEETRYSSVYRGIDDSGYDEIEDILLNSRNDETFGGVSGSFIGKNRTEMNSQKNSRVHDDTLVGHPSNNYLNEDKEKQMLHDQSQSFKAEGFHSLPISEKESSDKVGLSPNATAFDPSHVSSKGQGKTSSSNELLEGMEPSRTQGRASFLGSSASSTPDRAGAPPTSAGHGMSPSSSVGSLSSEKSSLNPHAKEFKFNANAKSFVPSQTPPRQSSPVADSPFYFPVNMTNVTHMHGMPVGVEIGPSFAAHQPGLFSPQVAPMAQPYYHPNGPQYGQQMMIGQPHPSMYMPTYPHEMQYK